MTFGGGSMGTSGQNAIFPAGFGSSLQGTGFAGGGGGGIDNTFNIASVISQTGSGEPQARLHQSRTHAQDFTRHERTTLEHMPLTDEERSRVHSLQDIKQGWIVEARAMMIT